MSTNGRRYPSYLGLLESGELEQRVAMAAELLGGCRLCPRSCGANRLVDEEGICRSGRLARVSCHFPHHGEEDCVRGTMGSGTIFFCGCNLLCAFCQNWDTSHECEGDLATAPQLAKMMLDLQAAGCHNINWVTPTHVLPQVLEALAMAARVGLHLPIVYNTSAYDCAETLGLLDGLVDIYMPDFKFWDEETSARFLGVRDYPDVARRAIREMHRQVGDLVLDETGLARRGLLVRHLVMPGALAGTRQVAGWLRSEISAETFINIMGQYRPAGDVLSPSSGGRYLDIARPITAGEYRAALIEAQAAGLHRLDGW